MEFGFVIIIAIAWAVVNAIREAAKRMPGGSAGGPGTGGPAPGRRRLELPESFADSSPGLRDLLDALEQAQGRAERPPPPRPRPPPGAPPAKRREPEPTAAPEGVSAEVFEDAAPVRRQRKEIDLDSESIEVARRRREAVARREAPRTAADHARFDARIRQEPADATAVASPATGLPDLRQALIWREILSPPPSLRDD